MPDRRRSGHGVSDGSLCFSLNRSPLECVRWKGLSGSFFEAGSPLTRGAMLSKQLLGLALALWVGIAAAGCKDQGASESQPKAGQSAAKPAEVNKPGINATGGTPATQPAAVSTPAPGPAVDPAAVARANDSVPV